MTSPTRPSHLHAQSFGMSHVTAGKDSLPPHAALRTDPSAPRFLSDETVRQIAQQVLESARGGDTSVTVHSWWNSELQWARNRVSLASDRRDIRITVDRTVDGARGRVVTNQWDPQSLEATVHAAERSARLQLKRDVPSYRVTPPVIPSPETRIWSDQTYNLSVEQRGAIARVLVENAEPLELLSAGYLEMRAAEIAVRSTASATPDIVTYIPFTQAQCSMAVRHPKGVGSGWAGLSSYDWAALDSKALAQRALEKCVASLNPVAVEPGRYTVILEPQAVFELIYPMFGTLRYRQNVEREENNPFALGRDTNLGILRTKLGLKIVDERITISHDPDDPLLGVLPSPGMRPITWIRRGVLETISYDRTYALEMLNENDNAIDRPAFHMSGGTTSIDEMIQTTARGVLVTRFSNLMPIDGHSLLCTGLTRDGLWLIEHGKIAKAIKNFRFTESPLFMLNQIEQLGVPAPIFWPVDDPYEPGVTAAIVPPLKVNDFSFTAMIDAV